MILLRDEVRIDATPEQVFDWLAHFQEHYLAWHPDHVECRYLRGSSILEKDAILYVEEYLHGDLHRLKLRATKVIPDSRVDYTAGFGTGGAFEVQPREDGVLFIAEVTIGLGAPGPGSWLDRMIALRDILGVFRLAYLESLIRAADAQASAAPVEVL